MRFQRTAAVAVADTIPIRAALTSSLIAGGTASAKILYPTGGAGALEESDTSEISVKDTLGRFSGVSGDKFWVLKKGDSRRYEILSPGGSGDALVRVQLLNTLTQGGNAPATIVEWDGATWTAGGTIVTVYDSLNRFGTAAGARLWVVFKNDSGRLEVVSPATATAGSTNEPIRIRLQSDLALGGEATAKKLVWDDVAEQYEEEGDDLTVREFSAPPHWTAPTDNEGWAILKSDRGDYEVIWLEMPARFMRSHSIDNIDGDELAISQDYYWFGSDPQEIHDGVVYDEDGFFPRILSAEDTIDRPAAKVLTTWDEQLGRHRIIQAHSKAGFIIFSTNEVFSEVSGGDDDGLVRALASITHAGGTQQDIQHPGNSLAPTAFVYDYTGILVGSPGGYKGAAILDAVNDRYVVVNPTALRMDWAEMGQGGTQTTSSGTATVLYTGGSTSAAENILTFNTSTGQITVANDGFIDVSFTAVVEPNSNYGALVDEWKVTLLNSPGSTTVSTYFQVDMSDVSKTQTLSLQRRFSLPNGSSAPIAMYVTLTNQTSSARDLDIILGTRFEITWFNRPD